MKRGQTNYWVKTGAGYNHRYGFVLTHIDNPGLITVGGLWTLLDANHNPLAYHPYSHHLSQARLFRWASEEISFYYRLIK